MPKLNKNKNNDYYENPKENCIETSEGICECLYDNLVDKINKKTKIIDIGCANGNLSRRFFENDFKVTGIDLGNHKKQFKGNFIQKDFFKIQKKQKEGDYLILCNPVWNNPKKLIHLSEKDMSEIIKIEIIDKSSNIENMLKLKDTRENLISRMDKLGYSGDEIEGKIGLKYKYNGMNYFPEMFIKHIFELFGDNCKVVFLTIQGFLMNNGINSKRYKWLRDGNFKLTSVLETPKDSFKYFKDQGVDMWNHVLFFNVLGLDPVWFMEDKYLEKLKSE